MSAETTTTDTHTISTKKESTIWDVLARFNTVILSCLLGISSFFIVRWINDIDLSRAAIAAELTDYKLISAQKEYALSARVVKIETVLPQINENVKDIKTKVDVLISRRGF